MVAHVSSPNAQVAEAGGLLLKAHLVHIVSPRPPRAVVRTCLKEKTLGHFGGSTLYIFLNDLVMALGASMFVEFPQCISTRPGPSIIRLQSM